MGIDQSAEILRLRATVRDLLSVSVIPEAWVGREPPAIAAALADLLIGSLELDFVFVRLCDHRGCQAVEITRGACWKGFREWLQHRIDGFGQISRTEVVTDVGGGENSCRGVVIPVGVNSERGLIAVASGRSDFPSQIYQQLLSAAANNASMAFQNSFLRSELRSAQEALRNHEQDLRKARDELEDKVVERTTELMRRERELRELLDSIPATVWSAEPDGSNSYVNRRFVEYSGIPPEQITGSGWHFVTHPDDLERHNAKWLACVRTGEPLEDEVRVRSADGQYRWHLQRGAPRRDEAGNIVKWYGVLTDIEDRKSAQEALRTSEAYLAEAQRLSKTGSFGWKPEIGEIVGTEEIYRIFNIDHAEKLSLNVMLERIHPLDRALVQEVIERASQTGADFEHEHRLLMADGRVKHVHAIAHALKNAPGSREFIGAVTDITERKTDEEKIRRLVDANILGIFIWNLEGAIVEANEAFLRMVQYDSEDIVSGRVRWTDLTPAEWLERDELALTELKANMTIQPYEKEYFRKDGSRVPVLIGGALFQAGGNEGVAFVLDLSEQKRAEEALRSSEAYLAEAQRMSQTGSWAWSAATNELSYWSEECCRLLGFDPAEPLPTQEVFFQRIHPDDQALSREQAEKGIRSKQDFGWDYRIIHTNGGVRDIRTVCHSVLDRSGNLVEIVGTIVDITERKAAEQEREKLRQLEADLTHTNRVSTLGEMAASLAHEIKQPLAAAITSANSCIEWLAHEPPNLDRARAAAARIDKYGNRAAEIIDRIRSFYRKSSPQRELVDVNGIVQEILTLLNGEVDKYSVTMHTDLSAELPKIMVDRVQLQQVFMNLMLNAIEAMKDSGGELRVKSEMHDGQLQFSVSDTGVGLPTGGMDQMFSAFFTTKPQGSGMGLAISRSIVESHGGQLWATDNVEGGAIFYFTLPTQVVEPSL
jgi:PAS domain S-box-containing protein